MVSAFSVENGLLQRLCLKSRLCRRFGGSQSSRAAKGGSRTPTVFGLSLLIYRILTALPANSAITNKEIRACRIMRIFAQRERGAVSVGEKAVLVLKARKR